VPQCPVRIDIPWLNENLRQRMNLEQPASAAKSAFGAMTGSAPEDRVAPLQKQFFANYHVLARQLPVSRRWRMLPRDCRSRAA